MQDISGTALPECKHPFSPQDWSSCQDFEKQVTQAPLGWLDMPHHAAATWSGAGVASRTQSGTIHKFVNRRHTEPGVKNK